MSSYFSSWQNTFSQPEVRCVQETVNFNILQCLSVCCAIDRADLLSGGYWADWLRFYSI